MLNSLLHWLAIYITQLNASCDDFDGVAAVMTLQTDSVPQRRCCSKPSQTGAKGESFASESSSMLPTSEVPVAGISP